jgi:hypothetical protein
MQRDGETIIFDESEQKRFGVPANLPAAVAVVRALSIQSLAAEADARGIALQIEPMSHCRTDGHHMRTNAAAMMGFASNILNLCFDEHLTLFATDPDRET